MHPAVPIIIVFLLTAAEITVLKTCTMCEIADYISPVSFRIDDYADFLCPGEELVHIPGTLDCELVLNPDDVKVPESE